MTLKTDKRKNDEKPRGVLRRWMIMIGVLGIATIITALVVMTRGPQTQTGPQLTGHLYYRLGGSRNTFDYVLNMATGERQWVTEDNPVHGLVDGQAKISPDGKWRAKWIEVKRQQWLSLSTFDKLHVRDFGPLYARDSSFRWASDSQSIIVDTLLEPSPDDAPLDIWQLMLDGSFVRLTESPVSERNASLSPDGTHIAYTIGYDYNSLYVENLATNEVTLVNTGEIPYNTSHSWSPDSQWIAFDTDHTGQSDIWIVRRDGTELQGVVLTSEYEQSPLWLP